MRVDRRIPPPWTTRAAVVVALAVAIWLYVTAIGPWALPALATTSVVVSLSRSRSMALAAAAGIAVVGTTTLIAAIIAHATSIPLVSTYTATYGAVTLGAAEAGLRVRGLERAPGAWLPRLALFTGPVVWLAAVAIGAARGAALPVAWFMSGDAANNVMFARRIVEAGGLLAIGDPNAVPLPNVAMSVLMAPGRTSDAGDVVALDLRNLAIAWILFTAAAAFLAGLVAWELSARVRPGRTIVPAIAGALGSLIPVTWFVGGFPISLGLINAPVALALMLASVLAYLAADNRVALALGALCLTAALLLATWSPLVVVPAVLIVLAAARHRSEIRTSSVPELATMLACAATAVAYGSATILPLLRSSSGALATGGGFVPFPRWVLPALAIAVWVLIAVGRRSLPADALTAFAILPVSLLLGLGIVLVAAGHGLASWSYYPHKFAWLSECLLLVVIAGLAVTVVPRHRPRAEAPLVGVLIGLMVIGLGGVFRSPLAALAGSSLGTSPLVEVATPDDESLAERVVSLADDEAIRVLWRSGMDVENDADFWILTLAAGDHANTLSKETSDAIRLIGYYPDHGDAGSLCGIATLSGQPVVALTRDPFLVADVAATCGEESGVSVVILP